MDFSKFFGIDADYLDGKSGSFYADIIGRLGYNPANKAGDTMLGPLLTTIVPTTDPEIANKKYVDDTVAAKLAEIGGGDTFCDCKGIALFMGANGFLSVERCVNVRGQAFVSYNQTTKIATIELSSTPGYEIVE